MKTAILICVCSIWSTAILQGQNLENLKDTKPFDISGSISASAILYNINGREAYREPFSWLLRGDPVFYIYGIAIPVTIVVSEQERDFRQPFNRFGISPEYKWAKLHLGYQNLQYSRYTLSGHSIVGAGIELNPGKLRFGYMYGQLLRAVQSSPLIDDQDFRVLPAFKRTGNSMKIGYGTNDNYVDLILLKGQDIASSLDSVPANLKPAENLVMAVTTHQKFLKHWSIELEYARSYYTEDIHAANTTTESDAYIPSNLFTQRTSTQVSTAIQGSLNYQGNLFFGGVTFERIDPGYRSMGAYFFLNDFQKITIAPGIKLYSGKWRIKTSLGLQENNLENTREYKTIRRIGGLMVMGSIGEVYRFSGNYSNYGVEQKDGIETVDPAMEIAQVTRQWNMMHTFNFNGESAMHNVNLMVANQNLSDQNEFTEQFSNYTSNTFSGNYMLSLMKSHFSTSAGFTYTSFNVAMQDISYYGPNLSLNKSFIENKLQTSLSANYFINKTDSEVTRTISRLMFRTSFRVTKTQKVTLRAQYGQSNFKDDPSRSYDETKMELSYGYRF